VATSGSLSRSTVAKVTVVVTTITSVPARIVGYAEFAEVRGQPSTEGMPSVPVDSLPRERFLNVAPV
jgi:hypothetical protein